MILALTNINISNAQTFVAAITFDSQAASSQINVQNTGNYSVEYESENFHAMVWDGDSPGLAWYNTNGDQGNMALDGTIFGQIEDPDIALFAMQNNNGDNVVYAFIIYLINGNVYYEDWEYNQGVWTINQIATQITFIGNCSTPNTDVDDNNLAAVWQEGFDIKLFQSNMGVPQNYTISTLHSGNALDYYQTPDIGVIDNRYNIVYIFNSQNYTALHVDYFIYGAISNTDIYPLLASGSASQFGNPRIAVPNHVITSGSISYHFNYQAVVRKSSTDGNEILGFNRYIITKTGPTQLNLTLTDYGNFEPVVTYTNQNNLIAAWIYDNVFLPSDGGGIIVPTGGREVLQTKLNINGGAPINPTVYFVVNYQYARNCYGTSVSGRFAKWDRVLYTAYDDISQEVFYKTSPYAGSNIRIGRSIVQPIIYPNPASEKLYINIPDFDNTCSIKLYDVNGRLILSKSISYASSILDVSELNTGVYYLRILGSNISKVEKIIIN